MNILFAPDYRVGVPYQTLLADALSRRGVNVQFLQGYKRVLPLSRLLQEQDCDILHLHWPEAYYPRHGGAFDLFRIARFPYDLHRAAQKAVLVTTAHNFHAHDRSAETLIGRNVRYANRKSRVVFAHSTGAKRKLVQAFGLDPSLVRVVPHGDLSVAMRPPVSQAEARHRLGLGDGKIALMFGAVRPYKGLEDVIAWWRDAQPAVKLAIVGKPVSDEYARDLSRAIGGTSQIMTRFEFLSDDALGLWLSAADAAISNYREILTSGPASLARSYGVPLLLPRRLDTVELNEPTPYVRRFTDFATDFHAELEAALSVPPDFAAAASWRRACSWDHIAELTMDGYRSALDHQRCAA
jgi:glycosyltransferase involved in cell wall biosynthesis